METTGVEPIRPPAPYYGGKRRLAHRLAPLIDQIPHEIYCEPFVGMGGVFFRRRLRPRLEIINDYNRDVITLFRVLQRHCSALLDVLAFAVTSRDEFERLRDTDPSTLTDMERATRFLYLQYVTYGGRITRQSFGVSRDQPAKFNVLELSERLKELHRRLAGVVLECMPWEAFLARYDTPKTLFYLDPPYWGSEAEYGRELFDRSDYVRLASLLGKLVGQFVLSLNDVAETREIFADFSMEATSVPYGVAGPNQDRGRSFGELIISSRKEGQ